MTFYAPAARAVTVLHTAAPGDPGRTRCGLPMAVDDLWIPVDKLPGDRLCPACADAADQQLELWGRP